MLAGATAAGQLSATSPSKGSFRRVLVTRARGQADALMEALRAVSLEPVLVPAIEVAPARDPAALDRAVSRSSTDRWLVATSANGVEAVISAAARTDSDPGTTPWAVIGTATEAALARHGVRAAFLPSEPSATSLAVELPLEPGDRVLVVRGELATDELARSLAARGADVEDVVAYRTIEAPASSRGLLRAALAAGPIAAVVHTSGSTVRGLSALATAEGLDLSGIPAVCIGEPTAMAARAAGHDVIAIARTADAETLATAAAGALTEAGGPRG
jgi:uroporphyrinogen-III synthase